MKCLTWNCRGTGNNIFRRNCKELLRRERPDIICILETKAAMGMGNKLARNLRFDGVFEVPDSGFMGGLILLLNPLSVNLVIAYSTHQCIHTDITWESVNFTMSFAYVQPSSTSKTMFWDSLKAFSCSVHKPWLVMGDLNDFALPCERKGGSDLCLNRIWKFRERFTFSNLSHPGCSGDLFTWLRKVHAKVLIQ